MQFRKVFLALAGIGISGSALALTPLAVNGFNNPNSCSNWIVGAAGAYVQPLGNDLDYATSQTTTEDHSGGHSGLLGFGNNDNEYSSVNANIHEAAIDPEYDWGWQGMIDYRFPQTTNDVQLGYMHFDNTDNDTTVGAATIDNNRRGNNDLPGYGGNDEVVNYIFPAGSSTGFHQVTGSLDNDYDAANLEFGHTFNDGRLGIRIHGGAQYARISSDMDITASGDSDTSSNYHQHNNDTITGVIDSDSDFHGIGPRVGIGATFDLGSGFSIYGDSGIELLVGDLESSVNNTVTKTDTNYRSTDTNTSTTNFSSDDQTTVVPGGDAEAGVSYTAALGNNIGLTVQGGYMVAGYVHPVKRTFVNTQPLPGDSQAGVGYGYGDKDNYSSPVSASSTLSDFGLQGPYIGLDLSF